MKDSMLDAADILVNRSPVIYLVLGKWHLVIVWISVAEIIPGGANKGIHGIGFPAGCLAAFWTGAVNEAFALGQWRNGTLLELYILWQEHWQLILWYQLLTAVIAVDNRNWCTPIPLTGNQPVTETVVYPALAEALSLSLVHDTLHGSLNIHAGEFSRIYQHAGLVHIGLSHFLQLQLTILWLQGNDNLQIVLGSKHPVTLILRRHADNRTSTVLSQYIVGYPDFHLIAVERIDGIKSGKDTFLLRLGGGTLHLRLILGLLAESLDLLGLWIVLTDFLNERMLSSQCQEGNTIYGVRTGSVGSNSLP